MKTNNKRGFTIVELVIVVAVIAILAAVLIPTFSKVIDKANRSADMQAAVTMNKILAADEVLNGKPETASEMVQVLYDNGYNAGGLDAKSKDYEFIWNSEANSIVLYDNAAKAIADVKELGTLSATEWLNWEFIGHEDEKIADKQFSVYVTDNYTGSTVTNDAGIDVGKNENVTTVIYETETAQSVVLNTKGGTVRVNAKNSDVAHYGTAGDVQITAVANASYHLYAEVNTLNVTAGRVVPEKGAVIAKLVAAATAEVVIKEDTKQYITIIDATGAQNVKNDAGAVVTVPAPTFDTATVAIVINESTGLTQYNAADFENYFGSGITGATTIKLLKDVTFTGTKTPHVADGANVTLDLGGKTLTTANPSGTRHAYIDVNTATLTVFNGTINARGLQAYAGAKIYANVNVNSVDNNGGACFWVYEGGSVEINGGTYKATNGNGYFDEAGIKKEPGVINSAGAVVINGGTFETVNSGCYAIQSTGTLVINNATVNAWRGALSVIAGTADINGGTFNAPDGYDRGGGRAFHTGGSARVTVDQDAVTFNGSESVEEGTVTYD